MTNKMFNSKKNSLFAVEVKEKKQTSAFVQAGLKNSARTVTGNGGEAFKTTGDFFTDQFGRVGSYREPRSFAEIARDCEILWAENKLDAVKFMFYVRMICRKINLENHTTETAQKGTELRWEGIMRLIWLHTKDKETFWKNSRLIPFIGSWKDIFLMLRYDLIYNGWEGRVLDWNKFGQLILSGLYSPSQTNLVKKYLPQVKAKSKCTTVEAQANCLIAKWLVNKLFGNISDKSFNERYVIYRKYAKLKASGNAHTWQQLISQRKYDLIDFDKIAGRALNLLVKSKFLDTSGLKSKYQEWIGAPITKEVKYTGFVHELFEVTEKYRTLSSMEQHLQDTINKQFMTLVNKCMEDGNTTDLIVVRDTSGSMKSQATGLNMTSYDVAKAIALYFSYFLKGKFQDAWIEFNRTAKLHQWTGETPLERWYNDTSSYVGNTDFERVLCLFNQIKAEGVLEEEFPRGIICISD